MSTATGSAPETLRAHMVEHVKAAGYARTDQVEQALRTVARHQFVPKAPLEDAYADIAVITKRDTDGASLSCASVPTTVAMMLDRLDVHPGHRVLEIGAGTGYNAALLAHLTGPAGHVTTVDIDAEVTAQAQTALDETGHHDVTVITRDGALGDPDGAPYDRIIVTVGAWHLPETWREQLVVGGRLVVPLRWRGQTQCVTFINDGDNLRSDTLDLCGFVPMLGQNGEHTGPIDPTGHVRLHWDEDQPIDPRALNAVLALPKVSVWSGATVGPFDSFDGVWLRLSSAEAGTCRMSADRAAIDGGLCAPPIPSRSPALVEGTSLAYFTLRRLQDDDERRSELGAIGHGPAGESLAERLCAQIRAWDNNRAAQPSLIAEPASALPDRYAAVHTIIKQHSRLLFTWD